MPEPPPAAVPGPSAPAAPAHAAWPAPAEGSGGANYHTRFADPGRAGAHEISAVTAFGRSASATEAKGLDASGGPGGLAASAGQARRRGWVPAVVRGMWAAPVVLGTAWQDAQVCCRAFDQAVLPLVEERVPAGSGRGGLAAALRAWSAKGGHMVAAYCRAAELAFTPEIAEAAALACSFARLYDDLLDEPERPGFAERVGLLFTSPTWTPRGPLETLAGDLFVTLDSRLGRPPGDPLYAALADVHHYQSRSARQRAQDVTHAELEEITHGKGGATLTVLFAIARPGMTEGERAAVAELGAVLQLCDDYHDRAADAALGIATLPGIGVCSRVDLNDRLTAAEASLIAHYGRRPARRLVSEAHVFLLLSAVGWATARLRPGVAASPPRAPVRPLAALLLRGPSAVAAATGRLA